MAKGGQEAADRFRFAVTKVGGTGAYNPFSRRAALPALRRIALALIIQNRYHDAGRGWSQPVESATLWTRQIEAAENRFEQFSRRSQSNKRISSLLDTDFCILYEKYPPSAILYSAEQFLTSFSIVCAAFARADR